MSTTHRPRILTGDQPTGRLHIGHWVGSLENRIRLQDDYDCYFLIANMHAFTTPDPERIHALEDRYARGDHIGDGAIKAEVAAAIDALVAPMRERRAAYDGPRGDATILAVLRAHAVRASEVANQTLAMARAAMKLDFDRPGPATIRASWPPSN